MPRTRSWPWLLLASTLLLMTSCAQRSRQRNSSLETDAVDLHITEAPWESQAQMTRRMNHVTTYLKNATGLKVRYVPAINYAHSYALVERGEADLILVGIYGGYRLLKAIPNAIPLAIQKPSYRLVLVGHQRLLAGLKPGEKAGLNSVQGRRIGFGSRFSGSAFLQPLLAMQDEGMKPSDINQCLHEPVQRHLPAQVANGLVDFAFIPTYTAKSDQFIPESLRDELAIVWSGPLSRNDYLIGVSDPMDPKKQSKLIKVQQAFLELDRTSNDGRAVLDAYALPGFEMPTKEFPEGTNQQIKTLLSQSEGLPTCDAS